MSKEMIGLYDQAKKDKLRLQMIERALSKKLITPNYYREAKAMLTGQNKATKKETTRMSIVDMKHFHTIEDLQKSVIKFLFDHEANFVVVHNKFDLESLQRLAVLSEFKRRIVLWSRFRKRCDGLEIKNLLVYGKRKEPNSDQFIEEIHDIFAYNNAMFETGKIYVHCLERNSKRNVDEDKQKLLVIELDDINAVPTVYYKGEKVVDKKYVNFRWRTLEEDDPGHAEFDVMHFQRINHKRGES